MHKPHSFYMEDLDHHIWTYIFIQEDNFNCIYYLTQSVVNLMKLHIILDLDDHVITSKV
jgi:hypothetical protein